MKTLAGLKTRLLLRQRQLCERIGKPVPPAAAQESEGDWADLLTAQAERVDRSLSLERLSMDLRQVEAALDRMAAGTFGVCLGCAEGIPPARLRAYPEAAYCLACQVQREEQERALGGRTRRGISDEEEDADQC